MRAHPLKFLIPALVLAFAACASAPTDVRMEPRSFADRLGLNGCRVSVPLTRSEVIEDARRVGNPHPEDHPEWIEMTEALRPGDQLRVANCLASAATYYYILVRDDSVIAEFHSVMFD